MIAVLVCLILMALLQLLVPAWWWIMIVPFAFGATAARSSGQAVRTGAFSAGLLWFAASLLLFLTGSRLVAGRVTAMFGLKTPWLIIAATALLAAFAGAVSGYAGHSVGSLARLKTRRGVD